MKKVAYVDPANPGIVRFYGGDAFDGVLAGTRAQMIVDALNAAAPPEEKTPNMEKIKRLLHNWRGDSPEQQRHILADIEAELGLCHPSPQKTSTPGFTPVSPQSAVTP